MIMKSMADIIAATAMLSLAAAPSIATAQTDVPGAKANDKSFTCADVTAERTAIHDAVAGKAAKKQAAAKVKKGLFGFAKTFAGMAIPGMAGGLGGGSMLGSIAAQSAGQTAAQAVNSADVGAATPTEAKPDAEQQARLERLDRIGAYRQCAA